MGYLHIDNFYKDQRIQLFKQCYALEKLHGTSAHIHWDGEKVTYFSGGEKLANFVLLFNDEALVAKFKESINNNITVYGEAYGGKQQGQSWRYGKQLKFCAFDVKIGDNWLNVPSAERFVQELGLEFVPYKLISTDIEDLDAARDAPSEQAKRNSIEGDKPMEGVVLRPLIEMRTSAEKRVITKHKRAEERETKTERIPLSPEEQIVLDKANEIAEEYVTPIRLEHVLDKLKVDGREVEMEDMSKLIKNMTEDIIREADGEIVDSRDARVAIGKKTVSLFKKRLSLIAANRVDLWPGFVVENPNGITGSEILT
jgi:hypothetical protein